MVAYTFKSRFIEPIERREKRQTIRAIGKKRHARSLDSIQIYTGDRFHPRKVGQATCTGSGPITLAFGDATRRPFVTLGEGQAPGDLIIGEAELDAFAVSDGFADWQALADFWAETHSPLPAEWTGILITWGETFAPAGAPAA